MFELDSELFKKAYKKLKSNIYYDKTQLILRDEIVRFENDLNIKGKTLDEELEKFCRKFTQNPDRVIKEILGTVTFHAFPKKIGAEADEAGSKEQKSSGSKLITNYVTEPVRIKEMQYFIDMDIRGHILGVVWLMTIGYRIDSVQYEHSYGNRIRRKLYNELSGDATYSPYLFEPYFEQYESWRDTALDEASRHLGLNQDVVIMTLDFRRFYYSVDMGNDAFGKLYEELKDWDELKSILGEEKNLYSVLNDFVRRVIHKYSSLFGDLFEKRNILPIGFLPSNVLANWCLRNFDKAVVDGWNPIYFGRYVDDIIIVDKLEGNSDLYAKAKKNELTSDLIISFFLKQCSTWSGMNCKFYGHYALLKENSQKRKPRKEKSKKEENEIEESKEYVLNEMYNPIPGDKSRITIQNDKVKIFHFKSGESDALISCFKKTIWKNKSEFRHMPEDEAVFQEDDYSGIYNLENRETINKFRGIDGISVDKFELSKLLGKHLRIDGLIEDKKETQFEREIIKIFNSHVIIENYTTWEKVIEIFTINERYDALKLFLENIKSSIEKCELHDAELCGTHSNEKLEAKVKAEIKEALYFHLNSAVCRAFSLVWSEKILSVIRKIYADENIVLTDKDVNIMRRAYLATRMMDKSVMPIFIDMLKVDEIADDSGNYNLTKFDQMIQHTQKRWGVNADAQYIYYPYMLTMYDFSMISCEEEFRKTDRKRVNPFADLKGICRKQVENYLESNYANIGWDSEKIKVLPRVEEMFKSGEDNRQDDVPDSDRKDNYFQVILDNERKNRLKIAIANVSLSHSNFERMIKDRPNRSYARYRDLSSLVNQALDEKADMLIMPESYTPYEWLPTLARTCARNHLAVITGVEYVKIGKHIFNLTAVILPYEDLYHRSAYITFHLKKHYAPVELQEINGYRLKAVAGMNYELYKWHDCYFPIYCCYELTSIVDRALFQSYADFLVAIEWNRDVNYYSNIVESLSRDIHCYCVQVNSSNYGDSRITKPSRTDEKDIIRTKGGINTTILVGEIDIEKLRDFQIMEYGLQKQKGTFKPTPPDFDPDIAMRKIKGESI